eukprot:TRINITY_DN3272_c0_g1_i6.p1 TRINITY_DN3272_c0_g1~~TRINITY_DN3272_c0_g1_i6.p1  ORF type:complete len:2846 (+),score=628.82 TRINITY_DN3272_c0_g1_i6:898-8538(+)
MADKARLVNPAENEVITGFTLDVADQLLQCPVLEKRLAGLNDIKEVIFNTDRAIVSRPAGQQTGTGTTATAIAIQPRIGFCFSEPAKLAKWLANKKIVELLFGPSLHVEVARRSVEVLRFMSRHHALSHAHLSFMWEASVDKHETVTFSVYSLLTELARVLTAEDRAFVYERVQRIPLAAYTAQHLDFVTSFCKSDAIMTDPSVCHPAQTENDDPPDPMGTDIFWALLQDDSPAPADVARRAVQSAAEVLTSPHRAPSKPAQRVITKCFENVQRHTSVPQSLQLVQQLLDPGVTKDSDIVTVLSEHNPLPLVLDDLVHWRTVMFSWAQACPVEQLLDSVVPPTKYSYAEHIQSRLDFLLFLVITSKVLLTTENMDLLWKALLVDAPSLHERDLFFPWLNRFLLVTQDVRRDGITNNDDVVGHTFSRLLTQLDPSVMGPVAFGTFLRYFRHVNGVAAKWETTQVPSGLASNINPAVPTGTILDADLIGLGALRRIVLEVVDPKVGNTAVSFLVKLQKLLAPQLQQSYGAIRQAFVQRCMDTLEQSSSALAQQPPLAEAARDKELLRMQRSLALLKTFLEELETVTEQSRLRHGAVAGGTLLHVTVHAVMGSPLTSKIIDIADGETLLTLKKKILEAKLLPLAHEPRQLTVICGGKALQPDNATLAELHVTTSVHVIRKTGAPTGAPDDFNVQPSTILSQPCHFDTLFRLLSDVDDPTIGQLIWELLCMLPTNQRLSQELSDIATKAGDPQWDQLLDSRSLFKLLYSLEIVESFLAPSPDPTEETRRSTWRAYFLQHGGLRHVCAITKCTDFAGRARGAKRRACLASLLHVFACFALDKEGKFVLEEHGDEAEAQQLVDALVKAITDSALAPSTQSPATGKSEEGRVVLYAMALLVPAATQSSALADQFLSSDQFDSFFCQAALLTEDTEIRSAVCEGLTKLCSEWPEASASARFTILQKALALLPHVEASAFSTCRQFFDLLLELLEVQCTDQFDFGEVFATAMKMLLAHPICERFSSDSADCVAMGLLSILRILVSHFSELKMKAGDEVIEEVFTKCLFELPADPLVVAAMPPPKCKTAESRQKAFDLLSELCRGVGGKENASLVLRRLLAFPWGAHTVATSSGKQRALWNYSPEFSERAACGYSGLQNQGCTCYMNSLLQQLYMHEEFRARLVTTKLPEANVTSQDDSGTLCQLRRLFAYLQCGQARYADTLPLCRTLRQHGNSGAPLNVAVQMDADEFFAQLFDVLEGQLKRTDSKDLLNECFGGTVCKQIISKECEHVSEREEGFYTLSLDVLRKKSVLESLDAFVLGDQLTGDNKYFCEKCSKKVDAVKRDCLQHLPRTLVVHCKRFEFDLELMRRIKVDDRYEFPLRLNLEPYTKEGLAQREKKDGGSSYPTDGVDSPAPTPSLTPSPASSSMSPPPQGCCEYELSGVLVHMGTADYGHYYSYARDRRTGDWLCFNDTCVEKFDPAMVAEQCYGGVDPSATSTWVRPRTYSAYMLFYQQCEQKKQEGDSASSVVATSGMIPDDVASELRAENMRFLHEKHLFDNAFHTFANTMATLPAATPDDLLAAQCLKFGTLYLFDTLAHSKDRPNMKELSDLLCQSYAKNVEACRWLLDCLLMSGATRVRHLLLQCPVDDVRRVASEIVASAVSVLAEHDNALGFCFGEEGDVVPPTQSDAFRFLDALLSMLYEVHPYWRTFSPYFELFQKFACSGPLGLKYVLSRGVIWRFVDLFLGPDSPLVQTHTDVKRAEMGDKFALPEMEHVAALCDAVRKRQKAEPTAFVSRFREDDAVMRSLPFLARLLRGTHADSGAVVYLIVDVCAGDEQLTRSVLAEIYSGIKTLDWAVTRPHFAVLSALLRTPSLPTLLSDISENLLKLFADPASNTAAVDCMAKFLLQEFTELPELKTRVWEGRSALIVALVTSASEVVREDACLVMRYAVPSEPDLAALTRDVLAHFDVVEKQQSLLHGDFTYKRGWRLAPYFRLLRWCVTGRLHLPALSPVSPPTSTVPPPPSSTLPEGFIGPVLPNVPATAASAPMTEAHEDDADSGEVPLYAAELLPFIARLYDVMFFLDTLRLNMDYAKSELVRLLWDAARSSDEHRYFITEEIGVQKFCRLLQAYVAINPTPDYLTYNARFLPAYYSLVHLGCRVNRAFLEATAVHVNFIWACQQIVCKTGAYPEAAQLLLDVMRMAADVTLPRSQELRNKFIADFASGTPSSPSEMHLPNVIKLFSILLQTEEDTLAFCSDVKGSSGLDNLCTMCNAYCGVDSGAVIPETAVTLGLLSLWLKLVEWVAAEEPATASAAPTPAADAVAAAISDEAPQTVVMDKVPSGRVMVARDRIKQALRHLLEFVFVVLKRFTSNSEICGAAAVLVTVVLRCDAGAHNVAFNLVNEYGLEAFTTAHMDLAVRMVVASLGVAPQSCSTQAAHLALALALCRPQCGVLHYVEPQLLLQYVSPPQLLSQFVLQCFSRVGVATTLSTSPGLFEFLRVVSHAGLSAEARSSFTEVLAAFLRQQSAPSDPYFTQVTKRRRTKSTQPRRHWSCL